jgi:hypothetical protein
MQITDNYNLAQINIARMKGVNIEDSVMKDFADNLDQVNALAENSRGFVWRLKDESNNATSINPYQDEKILVNVSVWENIESLENFTYKTFHTDFLKRRKEWFELFGKAYYALWWIPKGHFPTTQEAVERLEHLQKNGASETAFDFKNRFLPLK